MTWIKSRYAALILLSGALLSSGCTQPRQISNSDYAAPYSCHGGEEMVQTTLYFGLNRPAGPVISDAEWRDFVDNDVTPRFKDGLTAFDAKGQWLGRNGTIARENSKALMIIHDAVKAPEIETLRNLYKARFAQESVMRVDAPACVAF